MDGSVYKYIHFIHATYDYGDASNKEGFFIKCFLVENKFLRIAMYVFSSFYFETKLFELYIALKLASYYQINMINCIISFVLLEYIENRSPAEAANNHNKNQIVK